MKSKVPQIIDVSSETIDAVLLQVKTNCDNQTYQLIEKLVESYRFLLNAIQQKRTSIRRLLKLLFGPKTEKKKDVINDGESSKKTESQSDQGQAQENSDNPPSTNKIDSKPKRKGHGRRSASDYSGAQRNIIAHPTLKSGDPCPQCENGKVYDNVEPYVILRFVGQPPIKVTVWELEKLRCNLCGAIFSAPAPDQMGEKRWDETAQAMIALSRYGTGMPFNRLANLQANFGMPLPASTQWEAVNEGAKTCKQAFDELKRQAAQGKILHNDDTPNRVLAYMKKKDRKIDAPGDAKAAQAGGNTKDDQAAAPPALQVVDEACSSMNKITGNTDESIQDQGEEYEPGKGVTKDKPSATDAGDNASVRLSQDGELKLSRRNGKSTNPAKRKGVQTTGIISEYSGKKIALFFTGKKHAGENLDDVLKHRDKSLSPPTLMCDALDRNLPKRLAVLLANCLAHARRGFVDVFDAFPEQCRYLIDQLAAVYHNDDIARKQTMSDNERLAFHQLNSGPIMESLKGWLDAQIKEQLVEPNSSLGKAIEYMRNHWVALTLFLKVAGCPLDNNIVERALKKAILSRKNSLFFKTQHGADVGDIYTSLIHTCELNDINAFDYLTALLRHPQNVADNRW